MITMMSTALLGMMFGLLATTEATSCTALTEKTCAATNHMTDSCVNSQCQCVPGYEPKRTGCRTKLIPVVIIDDKTGTDVGASGEVLEGKNITLLCESNDTGDGNYVWMKGSTVLDVDKMQLTLTAVSLNASGEYRCKVAVRDYESVASSPVQISVIADNATWTFSKQPVIDGMPTRALVGAKADLTCINVPSGVTLTYTWYVNNVVNSSGASQGLQVTLGKTVVNYSCEISATSKPNITTPRSSEVKTPTILSDISGVMINSEEVDFMAETIKLKCLPTDQQLALSDMIFYSWKKNGVQISNGSDTYSKTAASAADDGSYTCTAKVGNNTVKESPAVTITFATDVIRQVSVAAKTPVPNGYLAIYCQVSTFDLSNVKFSWKKDNKYIGIDEDHILQINGWSSEDNGNYVCEATVGFVTKTSPSRPINSKAIDTLAPTPTSMVSIYGVGNTYTLTCDEEHMTPGMSYKWLVANTVISGQTSNTLQITPPAGTTTYTCQIIFNGTTSSGNNFLTITTKNLLAVAIAIADVTYNSTFKPLTGASVTLTCKVTKAAGATASGVSYVWSRNGVNLTTVSSSIYTFTANASNNGLYVCKAFQGSEVLPSATLNVTSSDVIETPKIAGNPDSYSGGSYTSYSEGGNYILTCQTPSHNSDFIYVWTRNGTTVSDATSRVYQINSAQSGHSGTYTCKASSGNTKSAVSDGFIVNIGAKGRPCLMADDCSGAMYASACENSRCKCADGYSQKGNTCSGQETLQFSLFIMFISCFISQRFN